MLKYVPLRVNYVWDIKNRIEQGFSQPTSPYGDVLVEKKKGMDVL